MKKLILSIIFAAMLLTSTAITVSAQTDNPLIECDSTYYKVGDTIGIEGSGFTPNSAVEIQIVKDGEIVFSTSVNATSEGTLPPDLSWNSTSAAEGTYTVRVLEGGETVAETKFGLITNLDNSEFVPGDVIEILGGGAEPNSTLNITITIDGYEYNVSVVVDENGEFKIAAYLPENLTTSLYNVSLMINGTLAAAYSFTVNASSYAKILRLNQSIAKLLDEVSGLNSTILQSLIAKLKNAVKKLNQALQYASENRTKLASNMLKAARNILKAFIHEVKAQENHHLTAANASKLLDKAQKEIDRINGLIQKALGDDKDHQPKKLNHGHSKEQKTKLKKGWEKHPPKGKFHDKNNGLSKKNKKR